MKFIVEDGVFKVLPNLCIGVVVAKGIDNHNTHPEIDSLLERGIKTAEKRFEGKIVKEDPDIVPYREAFKKLGINPNKYMCSVEALFTRIAKGKGMPRINPLVDLNNAVSLLNTLPMGTHDLSLSKEDISLRFAKPGDSFLPFGSESEENPEVGEVVYAVKNQTRTRRWAWRQSEHGKIDENSSFIFFPIDGFVGINDDRVEAATSQLEELLKKSFNCKTIKGFVDKTNPTIIID